MLVRGQFGQSEQRNGPGGATQPMLSERREWLGASGGDGLGDEHRAGQWTAQSFDAAGDVDGRADGGEIEAVRCADIAVHHGTEMQPDTEWQRREPGAGALLIEACHAITRRAYGCQCGVACDGRAARFQWENSEQPVADEFQHFTAEGMDGADQAGAAIIEGGDHLIRRHRFRQMGEIAEVGDPHYGFDHFAGTAVYRAAEYASGTAAA